MIDTILFYTHHTLNLLWGVILSAAFCGVRPTKRNCGLVALTFLICGAAQLSTLILTGNEAMVWKLYPLVVHLPLALLLVTLFRKRFVSVLAAVSLAYLCCQPSKWFGLVAAALTDSTVAVWCVKIVTAAAVAVVSTRFLARYVAQIFTKNTTSVLLFSSVPLLYYLFDYTVGVYTDLSVTNHRLATEFLSFALCIFFMLFCIVYYKEYERKADAERKEQIIRIAAEQQAKEVETIKKSNLETTLLRHDMRLMLGNLALCIEQNDQQQALKMISGFASQVEAAALHRYCKNDTINYILTNFESKCHEQNIQFCATVEIETLAVDENLFASILSNALDNAINAQTALPTEQRCIKLMLKESDDKLLLSVKNPFKDRPVFADGIPLSNRDGHGYGTQSIWYMTERLGGKCQFSIQNDHFVLRVVL